MKPIGGYFELELNKGNNTYHSTSVAYKSGRSSLRVILEILKPSLVYVPFYTCDGLIEPIEELGIKFQYYAIDKNLEPINLPELKQREFFIYVNYFDIKREFTKKLSDIYGYKLIADCTQAFFTKGNGKSWFFNSCRKFFGVPDGSYLYFPKEYVYNHKANQNKKYQIKHLLLRFNGDVEAGYTFFKENEILCNSEFAEMSKLTKYLLSNIDYSKIMEKRKENFHFLKNQFDFINVLKFNLFNEEVPMFYPLYLEQNIDREVLYQNKIFIPTFWKDVLNKRINGFEIEKNLSNNLFPLPIDHRYTIEDMKAITKIIKQLL